MAERVEWTHTAEKDMRRLDAVLQKRIRKAVQRLAATGEGNIRKLKGPENEFRLRVGDWRVRFTIERGQVVILVVLHVSPRGSAYNE